MAQIFPSFSDNLRYLETGSYDDANKPADNNGVITLSEPASQADYNVKDKGGNTFDMGTKETSPTVTPVKTSSLVGKTGNIYSRLFDPFASTLKTSESALKDITGKFGTEAGDSRSWEGLGAQTTIENALKPASNDSDWATLKEAAKSLASASYQGPKELSANEASQINANIENINQYSPLLKSQAGVRTLLKQAIPGLTPGEYAAEAARIYTSPEFAQRSSQLLPAAGKFADIFKAQSDAAKSYAAQRQAEEEDIASRAREYLTGQKGTIESSIQAELDKRLKNQADQEAAYMKMLQEGVMPDASLIKNASALNSQERLMSQEAEKEWKSIINKYADIKDMPLMVLDVDRHGREHVNMPEEWKKAHPEYKWGNKLYERLAQRQAELEALFSPKTTRVENAGKYAAYKPLYGTSDKSLMDTKKASWTPWSAEQMLDYDPGTMATFENTTTEDQRGLVNTINELLGDVERLEAAGEPYRAAQIAVNLETLLAQTDEIQAREKALGNWSKKEISEVNKARRQYKKSKGGGVFGKMMRAFSELPGGDVVLDMVKPIAKNPVLAAAMMFPDPAMFGATMAGGEALDLNNKGLDSVYTKMPSAKPYAGEPLKFAEASNQKLIDKERALLNKAAAGVEPKEDAAPVVDAGLDSGMVLKVIKALAKQDGLTEEEEIVKLLG